MNRSVRFVAFDWDGTAVSTRADGGADHLLEPLTRLRDDGVVMYVVTGTKHVYADRQLTGLSGSARAGMFVCANRGSEVYVLGPGESTRLFLHERTAGDEADLDAVVSAVTRHLHQHDIAFDLVKDRLNRVKIDVVPEWPDPPKDRLGELLGIVESHLASVGGLRGAMDLAADASRRRGSDLKISSDAKHIEVGLTDKADSMRWVLADIERRGGRIEELLVVGDEFGSLGGVEGSDARTIVHGAEVVSVGPEPGGAPPGVTHLGGGPARFAELLGSLPAHAPSGGS